MRHLNKIKIDKTYIQALHNAKSKKTKNVGISCFDAFMEGDCYSEIILWIIDCS